MLSIVIPTLNEEKCLPFLLESIKKQNFKDYEVIVADAGSKDKTAEIARQYGCKVVKGGVAARGRNEGAKISLGDTLLFIDSDMTMPEGFLQDALEKFNKRNLGVAGFPCLFKGKKIDAFASKVYNAWMDLTQKFLPHSFGVVMARKDVHNTVKGFDETIKAVDDVDYVSRASKISKFGFLKTTPLPTSSRRIEKDGRFTTYSKYILIELHLIFLGPIKTDVLKYKFGHYDNKDAGNTQGGSDKRI